MFINELNKLNIISLRANNKFSLNLNLNKIYSDFYKIKNNIENYNEKNITDFDINNFINSYDYSKKMKNSINKLKKFKQIHYQFYNTDVHLNFYYNKLNNKYIKQIINLTNFNIVLFNELHNNPRKNVNINFLLTNNKKTININKDNQLTKDNINSGYTQSFQNSVDDFIVIYRIEELMKVLTHEMIHLYGLHIHQRIDTKINKIIQNNNKFFSIYESYVESFAIIFYTFYYSKINKLDFNELLNNQIKFSYIQSAKLLFSQNIIDINHLKDIKEETNAISYHLLKTCILTNLNKFKKIFNKKNGFLLENKDRVLEFDNILIKSFKSEKKQINNFLDLIKNNEIDNLLLKTFRMNILD